MNAPTRIVEVKLIINTNLSLTKLNTIAYWRGALSQALDSKDLIVEDVHISALRAPKADA